MNDSETNGRLEVLTQLESKIDNIFQDVQHDGSVMPNERLGQKESNMIRMQRAISWLLRDCELQMSSSDSSMDITFIMHWIAFEALYGTKDYGNLYKPHQSSSSAVKEVLGFYKVIEKNEADRERHVKAMLDVWSDIILLVENPFIDPANWARYYEGTTKAGSRSNPFARKTANSRKRGKRELNDIKKFTQILQDLFRRLYQLRDQLFHGNASHKGSEDHDRASQIVSGARVMQSLLPVLIESMLDAMEFYPDSERWGMVLYPRIRFPEKSGKKLQKPRGR